MKRKSHVIPFLMALPLVAVRPFVPHWALRGKPHVLSTVIFDVSRTIADAGGMAVVLATQSAFAEIGHDVSRAEIMVDMGIPKPEHLTRIAHRRGIPDFDIDAFYEPVFLPKMIDEATHRSGLFPDFLAWWRAKPAVLKTGVWSMYPRAVFDPLLDCFANQGVVFDAAVCASDAPNFGRPKPHALTRLFHTLDVDCPSDAIVVGDSSADMLAAAALNCVCVKYVDFNHRAPDGTPDTAVLDARACNDGTHVVVTDYESQLSRVLETYTCY